MTRFWLSSTTALALTLNMAVPLPVSAQGENGPPACSDELQFPCLVPGLDIVVQNEQEFQALAQAGGGSAESQSDPVIGGAGASESNENDTPNAVIAPPEAAEEPQAAPEAPAVEAEAAPAEEPTADEAAPAEEAAPAAEGESQSTENDTPEAVTDAPEENAQPQAAPEAAEAEPAPAEDPATDAAPENTGQSQSTENETPGIGQGAASQTQSGENATPDIPAVANPEAQAEAAARAEEESSAAAAAGDGAEAVETQQSTVTEEEARSSNEEFTTSASGQEGQAAQAQSDDDDDDKVLKLLGTAAAAGLGAYAIGKLLDGGGKVVSNTGDRVVVEQDGQYRILKDDDTLLRRPGSDVATQTYSDGSTRTVVTAENGTQTETIRAANGRVLSRVRVLEDGQRVVLFDDTKGAEQVDLSQLQDSRPAQDFDYSNTDVDDLRTALAAASGDLPDRRFSLNQVRQIDRVRHLVPVIALDAINFDTGSAVIRPQEAEDLSALGRAMRDSIAQNPNLVFLIEGHTDTVGAASYNLALSDRRAESVALALSEYFDVPPANMIVQGYGESDLKERREGNIRANRRGAVRNITRLLQGSAR